MEKLPYFFTGKDNVRNFCAKEILKTNIFHDLFCPFLVNHTGKVNIFSFSGIYLNFSILQAISKNIKMEGRKL
jgi:hypothetical protein